MRVTLIKHFALMPVLLMVFLFNIQTSVAQETVVRGAEDILAEAGGVPTVEVIEELFINCSEWDEEHSAVQTESRDALIKLGVAAAPTLLDQYMSSIDLRRRIELDTIIVGIGNPATPFLFKFLDSEDYYTRRHAAYLIGDTAFINTVEDPLAVGLLHEDSDAEAELVAALQVETDWHVIEKLLYAIGKFRDPAQAQLLASYMNNPEESIRLGAVIALGNIPHVDVVSYLIRAFNDEMTTVRQAAVLKASSKTLGNLGFETIIGSAILSPGGPIPRLCALETVSRYLKAVQTEASTRIDEQRVRALDAAKTVIESAAAPDMWEVRGFAISVIAYTYLPEAETYLSSLLVTEKHPFVTTKIYEALGILEAGPPEPEPEIE